MAKFPEVDLPATIPRDLELRLQIPELLNTLHNASEDSSNLYPVSHKAIRIGAEGSLDTVQLLDAIDTGIKTFEAVGGLVNPTNQSYVSPREQKVVFASARQFVDTIHSTDDFLSLMLHAEEKMIESTPELTGFIEEVAGHYFNHDKVATRFALKGAAAIRGMQIFVDRRIATTEQMVD